MYIQRPLTRFQRVASRRTDGKRKLEEVMRGKDAKDAVYVS